MGGELLTAAQLNAFKQHMEATVNTFLDQLESGETIDNFDLVITLKGESITLPFHADLYCNLESLINDELKDL